MNEVLGRNTDLIKDSIGELSSSNSIFAAAFLAKDNYGLDMTDAVQGVRGKKPESS